MPGRCLALAVAVSLGAAPLLVTGCGPTTGRSQTDAQGGGDALTCVVVGASAEDLATCGTPTRLGSSCCGTSCDIAGPCDAGVPGGIACCQCIRNRGWISSTYVCDYWPVGDGGASSPVDAGPEDASPADTSSHDATGDAGLDATGDAGLDDAGADAD